MLVGEWEGKKLGVWSCEREIGIYLDEEDEIKHGL